MKMTSGNGNIVLEHIPGEKICGICGSGLIDALAELRKNELLLADGYMISKGEAKASKRAEKFMNCIAETDGKERGFCFYDGERGHVGLTQKDIRNLQLAKAAIRAAVFVLLERAKVEWDELDKILLTGVLGSRIRLANALEIGLLPRAEKRKFKMAGNAALEGAALLLEHQEKREEGEKLAEKICHVELAGEKKFQELFLNSMDLIEK